MEKIVGDTMHQKVSFSESKGWRIGNKAYPDFESAEKAFRDIKVRTNGVHKLNPVASGRRYVYAKLGGWTGIIENLLFRTEKHKAIQKEKQWLNTLERREEQVHERKAQKRLTRYGFRPPVKKSQYQPYAFRR